MLQANIKLKEIKTHAPKVSTSESWLSNLQQSAFKKFQENGFPTRKDEAWKYLNLETVLETTIRQTDNKTEISVEEAVLEKNYLQDSLRFTAINGMHQNRFSQLDTLPNGVIVTDLQTALEKHGSIIEPILSKSTDSINAFAELNTAYFENGIFVHIPADTKLEKPLQLLQASINLDDKTLVNFPRIIIALEKGAEASITLHEIALNDHASLNSNVSNVHVEESAKLELTQIQRGNKQSLNFGHTFIEQAKNSRTQLFGFTHNGAIARNEIRVKFTGEGAHCQANGLSLLGDQAQAFHHLHIDHAVPRCSSRQIYKHILNDEAKSEYNSLVHVAKGAVLSDSTQLNRNMVLSKKARAWTRPQLQVFCDDVKAAHGATVGQVSEEELFYLQSRGLSKEIAKAILIYGFAEEVIVEVSDKNIRAQLVDFVKQDLENIIHESNNE